MRDCNIWWLPDRLCHAEEHKGAGKRGSWLEVSRAHNLPSLSHRGAEQLLPTGRGNGAAEGNSPESMPLKRPSAGPGTAHANVSMCWGREGTNRLAGEPLPHLSFFSSSPSITAMLTGLFRSRVPES